jgi:hypothetical protein
MVRDLIDFNAIEPRFKAIHERLENWSRTLKSSPGSATSPMFRLYRADNWERPEPRIGCDIHDAHRVDKGVRELPQDHRIAVQWFYVRPTSPRRVCQAIGCTMRGLDDLVRASRSMLINRRI